MHFLFLVRDRMSVQPTGSTSEDADTGMLIEA